MILYIEVSDGVQRKTPPEMIKASDLSKWQEQHQDTIQGLFSSVYMYPTDDPYIGGVLSDFYVDLDCEENPDRARQESVALVKKLTTDYGIPEGNIGIAFSGMKGISVTIDHRVFVAETSSYLPLIWKSIVQELIAKLNLKTVDVAIYERRRLWRLPNSRHQKSGLYKIPLTLAELENMKIEKIKELAVNPRSPFTRKDAQVVEKATEVFQEHKAKVESWLEERKDSFEKTELKTLEDDPPCIQKRLGIGAEEGQRNICLFQLSVYYAHKGLSEPEILKIANEFAVRCKGDPPLTDQEIESAVRSAIQGVEDKRYSVGCSSEALAELCDRGSCPFFAKPKKKKKNGLKESCGENLDDIISEQTLGQKYIVYDKATGTTSIAETVKRYQPFQEEYLLWKPVGEPEPYGTEEQLFNEAREYIWEHLDLQMGYDILATWVLASWIPERWRAVPYLFFYGPPGSGKTWALEVLASIGLRPFIAYNASLASIFRVLDEYHLTLFLDETEVYIQENRMEMLSLLNNGYRRGGKALRTVEIYKDGVKDFKPRPFDVFGFKAMTGTKELIDTLMSRCIIFNMALATRPIKTEIDEERAEGLRRKLLAYRFKMLSQKDMEKPEIGLRGRLKELFEPLIIVAPSSAKQGIINEALGIQKQFEEELKASPEAMVFRAIIEAHDNEPYETRIAIKQIVEIVNRDLSYEEQMTNETVGKIASKLGFKRCLKNRQRGIFWNEELALRHASRYYTEWVAKREGQRAL